MTLGDALELNQNSADRDIAAIDDALQALAQFDPRKEKWSSCASSAV